MAKHLNMLCEGYKCTLSDKNDKRLNKILDNLKNNPFISVDYLIKNLGYSENEAKQVLSNLVTYGIISTKKIPTSEEEIFYYKSILTVLNKPTQVSNYSLSDKIIDEFESYSFKEQTRDLLNIDFLLKSNLDIGLRKTIESLYHLSKDEENKLGVQQI